MEIVNLKPEQILAEDNSRFGLKDSRVASLAEDIKEHGVMVPVEVETGTNGKFRLISGFYRLAAVTLLNQSGAGLTVPASIVKTADDTDRLLRQLAENMERENQSPMDKAIAIKKLLDAGKTRMEVREVFAVPGGRKGAKKQPASNSFLNIHLSFLEFPKRIQNMIHIGEIPLTAGYELAKHDSTEWDAIVDAALKSVEDAKTKEGREEERYLREHAKEEKARTEHETASAEYETSKGELKAAEDARKTAADAEAKAYSKKASLKPSSSTKEERETADKAFRDAQLLTREATKAEETARKKAATAETKFAAAEKKIGAVIEKVASAKDAKKKAGGDKKLGAQEMKAAAAATGAAKGASARTPAQMRDTIKFLTQAGGTPKVHAIGALLNTHWSGLYSPTQVYKKLQEIVGETGGPVPGVAPVTTAPAAPAAAPAEKGGKGKK